MSIRKIALFASGSGSNVQNIIEYFADNEQISVDSVWSNNPNAFALTRASDLGVETFVFDKNDLNNSDKVSKILLKRGVNLIVLAGFLWLIPVSLIRNFTIINIHPALLPKYGGKGMYGSKVHEAVVKNGEKDSGITVHYVNEKYDEGKIILQEKCEVLPTDTPETVAEKVHQLEYRFFPRAIEMVLKDL